MTAVDTLVDEVGRADSDKAEAEAAGGGGGGGGKEALVTAFDCLPALALSELSFCFTADSRLRIACDRKRGKWQGSRALDKVSTNEERRAGATGMRAVTSVGYVGSWGQGRSAQSTGADTSEP